MNLTKTDLERDLSLQVIEMLVFGFFLGQGIVYSIQLKALLPILRIGAC